MKTQNSKVKTQIYISKLKTFAFCVLVLSFAFCVLNSHVARAETMKSTNYELEQTNLNMTSGKKSSANFTVSDTVGQTAPGKYTSAGFIVRAGFQYYYSIIPFRFAISKTAINLGSLDPDVPGTDSATLTISSGGAHGYQVTAIEDDQLRINETVFIPDTQCNNPLDPCNLSIAKQWNLATAYGFGYNMTGSDIPVTFTDDSYYRPFPSQIDGNSPAIVMNGTNAGRNIQSIITFKANISNIQQAGQYENIINFVATPTY